MSRRAGQFEETFPRKGPRGAKLKKQGQDLRWDLLAECWVGLENAGDVGQVFLTLAGAPRQIGDRPNLSLENVLEAGHGQTKAQKVAGLRVLKERVLTGVSLDLDPQVRAGRGKVQTVGESFHDERFAQQAFRPGDIAHGDDQIETQAHHRVRVGVDGLASDHAKPYPVVGQEGNQPVEEIDLIRHDSFPES